MNHLKKIILLFIIFMVIFIIKTFAFTQSQINNTFLIANTHYENGEYEKALNKYIEIQKTGLKNYILYYNIANTYMKIEPINIGKAILYYNRALHYNNNKKEIIENLNIARKLVVIDVKNKDTNNNIINKTFLVFNILFSINTLTIILLILFTFSILLFSYYLTQLGNNKTILKLSIITAILFMFFLIIFIIQINIEIFRDYAVVMDNNTQAYLAPSVKQQALFTLSEGVELEIEKRISTEWYLIKLPNGLEGYVKSENIEMIKNF